VRLTARRPAAVIVLLVAGLAVRHLLVDPLEPAEAEAILRAARARDLSAQYLPRVTSPDGTYDREAAQEYAEALRLVHRETYANVRVKNTWLPPIKVRQATYLVEVIRERSGEPEYYRVRGPFVRRTSRWMWLFPIL
jgi:hypothetical protein